MKKIVLLIFSIVFAFSIERSFLTPEEAFNFSYEKKMIELS